MKGISRLACFWGLHEYVDEPPEMSGRLVIYTKICTQCGLRKGRVEKL